MLAGSSVDDGRMRTADDVIGALVAVPLIGYSPTRANRAWPTNVLNWQCTRCQSRAPSLVSNDGDGATKAVVGEVECRISKTEGPTTTLSKSNLLRCCRRFVGPPIPYLTLGAWSHPSESGLAYQQAAPTTTGRRHSLPSLMLGARG
ncbi:hypothetical protein SpCBS45565_g01543 [Spizellomyces sp. 'palustris']|nr:hypothetical protein SpCBS45565_g01543 [Spizellomyces sp. 'palustris']